MRRGLELRQQLDAHAVERRLQVRWDRLARAGVLALWIRRPAVHDEFVVQMRAGCQTGRADETDGFFLVDALPDVQSLCELRQMAVARPDAVGVTQLDQVAVAALSAGDSDDAVGGRADRRAVRGRVIRALVRTPALQNRMVAIAEPAGDVAVLQRRA